MHFCSIKIEKKHGAQTTMALKKYTVANTPVCAPGLNHVIPTRISGHAPCRLRATAPKEVFLWQDANLKKD